MKSLLHRATEIRKTTETELSRLEQFIGDEGSALPESEKHEILDKLNEIVSKDVIKIKAEDFKLKPLKKDITAPLIISLLAIAIAAGGIYYAFRYFNSKEQTLITEQESYTSAESKVVETLKKESEKQLNEKKKEIQQIQTELGSIAAERDSLKNEMSRKISEKEAQYNAELNKKLEAEREKLKKQGLSASSIEDRIKSLTQSMKLENNKKIAEFKKEADAELKQKETELSKRIAQYQDKLKKAFTDQKKLESEYKQKETALKEKYQREKKALETKQQTTANRLLDLEKQRRDEQFAFSQLFTLYSDIQKSINSTNYKKASDELNGLDNFLAKKEIASLPSIKERLPLERFIIKSLRDLIAEKTAVKNPIENTVKNISSMIKEADKLYGSGKTELAREKYMEAINAIPEVKIGYEKIANIDKDKYDKSISGLKARDNRTINSLRKELAKREKELAAKNDDLSRINSTIYSLRTQLKSASEELSRLQADEYERKQGIENVLLKIKSQEGRVSSLLARASTEDRTSEKELLSLLETKILVKRIISSASVKKKYPDLYNKLEQYFNALGREKQREGELRALGDILKVLDYIIPAGQTISSSAEPSIKLTGYEYKELRALKGILTHLKKLTTSF